MDSKKRLSRDEVDQWIARQREQARVTRTLFKAMQCYDEMTAADSGSEAHTCAMHGFADAADALNDYERGKLTRYVTARQDRRERAARAIPR